MLSHEQAYQLSQNRSGSEAAPGLDHVVHLAQHVLEEHRLLAEALHAVQLLLVEVLQVAEGSINTVQWHQ